MSGMLRSEFDYLFSLEKVLKETDGQYDFPVRGDKVSIPYISRDRKEEFLFDFTSSGISVSKYSYQSRARKTELLSRLDLEGSPHCNPRVDVVPLDLLKDYNGIDIPCPHVHIYVEGFNLKWAVPASEFFDLDGKSAFDIAEAFLTYCNAVEIPELCGKLV